MSKLWQFIKQLFGRKPEPKPWYKILDGAIIRQFVAGEKISVGDNVVVSENGTVIRGKSLSNLAGIVMPADDGSQVYEKWQAVNVMTQGGISFSPPPDSMYYIGAHVAEARRFRFLAKARQWFNLSDVYKHQALTPNALPDITKTRWIINPDGTLDFKIGDDKAYRDELRGIPDHERRRLYLNGDWRIGTEDQEQDGK